MSKFVFKVRCLGCEWFALLFDDIEPTMSDVDKQKFTSFAEAQVNVTNEVFDHLHQPQFMFCPTGLRSVLFKFKSQSNFRSFDLIIIYIIISLYVLNFNG